MLMYVIGSFEGEILFVGKSEEAARKFAISELEDYEIRDLEGRHGQALSEISIYDLCEEVGDWFFDICGLTPEG